MANISLKIQSGETIIELSGESKEVKEILQDIKENGLRYLSSNINEISKLNVPKSKMNENDYKANKTQTIKKSRTKVKGTITSTYEMIDLELTDNQRKNLKEYYSSFSLSTNVQRICVLCYWYKNNIGDNEFDTNTIFTLLRTVQEKASFNIPQAFSDIQKRNQYLVSTGEKGKYKLTPIGEDYVTEELLNKSK